MYRLGIDIGGTKINIGIIKENGKDISIVVSKKVEVKTVKDATSEIKNAVVALCKENGVEYTDIASCGVGIPGTVSRDGKKILKVPNIAILSENFAEELEAALDIPVKMLQDSRAAAWGEYKCGGGKGLDTVICMTLGTGIGTGIVINGKIYNGALLGAGELGHIPVVEGGRPCGCGKRGCLEKYCAGGGFDITAREMLGEGNTAKELFEAARQGRADAKKAIDDAVVTLGRAIVSAVNLLSPNCILFSGGLSAETEYLSTLIEYVKEHCYSSSGELPILKKAELGALSPLVGAALYQ
ncbi:MAG: ROK family protein [Ruminococcaceae bacterium]|nr:ROK family protein [Oscillospiraceae bacterium]